MISGQIAPVACDILLAGGGHSHVQVMTAFAMARDKPPGLRLTLVSEQAETPYSGMLPGAMAGLYTHKDMHIDLARLAQSVGVRFICARAHGLDRAGKKLLLENRPPLSYDFLSLNIGIAPDLSAISGAQEYGVPVKPISAFLARFEKTLAAALQLGGPRRFVIVGGGAAGVEIACALYARLQLEAPRQKLDASMFQITLASRDRLLPTLNTLMRKKICAGLAARGINVVTDFSVCAIDEVGVQADDGRRIAADTVFFATAARAPDWLGATGLPLDASGAVQTTSTLQVLGEPAIFATGDCASILGQSRPKAGVFAVRQGPTLARNLLAAARPHETGLVASGLKPYRAQKTFLTIMAMGDGTAIAGRGRWFAVEGALVWRWKDWIDRRFMAMFSTFGAEQAHPASDADLASGAAMRCAGCAAKIGPGPLMQALARLAPAPPPQDDVLMGMGARDDAAVIALDADSAVVETIDAIPAFIDDAYIFGQIAALHAMNDVLAMGGAPTRALALASLPYARPNKAADDLFQLLAGARYQLDAHGVTLTGGHSSEGTALALGFAVSGRVARAKIWTKSGLQAGDRLILTKPIGVGLIMAAHARGAAPAQAIQSAIAAMLISNFAAARCIDDSHGVVHGVTDVTGFGLAGHLMEMLRSAATPDLAATLDLAAIPLLPGALALAQRGFRSSLTTQNQNAADCEPVGRNLAPFEGALLFDPQTSGPLLIALAPDRAEACLERLHEAGYGAAAIIGAIKMASDKGNSILLERDDIMLHHNLSF